jgi:PQQ-dependent catabolism-associated CXXCW motif protein
MPQRRTFVRAVMRQALMLLLGVAIAVTPLALAGETPTEPDGYRLEDYRAPTPLTVMGRPALDTAAAERLWTVHEAVFIDVIAAPRRPDNLPAGAVWDPKRHLAIPGSLWLPDSGRGALGAEFETWLRARLTRIAEEHRDSALVFYCKAECWMSWNAAKRALAWGFAQSRWYRDGIDGWSEAGLPVEAVVPPDDLPR